MRYREIIRESDQKLQDSFAQRILDILTPLAANGVEYVTIDQIIQKMKSVPSGLYVDRELIMSVLDPNNFPLIKSIEGDKLMLTKMQGADRAVTDQQDDKEQKKIKSDAVKQAVKSATS